MYRWTAIALLIFVGLTSHTAAQKKTNEAEEQLQGRWKTTKAIYDGKEYKIDGMFVSSEMEFEKGKFKSWAGGEEFFGDYKLDTSKDPMWITLAYDAKERNNMQGTSFRGLFLIDEDKLTIVTNIQRRPKELTAKSTSLNMLLEFERVKDD